MGLLDDVKGGAGGLLSQGEDLVKGHADQVDAVIDKVEDFVDDKTGGKFDDQVDKVTDVIRDKIGGGAD
jgi:hypothetical protein